MSAVATNCTKTFPVHFLAPGQLKPYYRNSKVHSKANVDRLAKLVRRFDFDQPIVVDKDLVIIKGHGRYMAALHLNKKLVPVIIRDDLTPEQVAAARIADNQIFDLGETDQDLLRQEVMAFQEFGGADGEQFFDFLKPAKEAAGVAPEKASGPKVEVSEPSFKGTMVVCPACSHTQWEERSE